MAFDFKKIITSVAPMLGTALGGPLGGAAATAILDKFGLGGKVDPSDSKALEAAITPMLQSPETLLKLKEVDNEFTVTMSKLQIDSVAAMAALDNADLANARAREIAVRDYTPEVGFYMLLATFAFFLRWLFKYPVPDANRAIIYSAFGSLATLVIMSAQYFYGTTRASANKDMTIQQVTGTNQKLLKA